LPTLDVLFAYAPEPPPFLGPLVFPVEASVAARLHQGLAALGVPVTAQLSLREQRRLGQDDPQHLVHICVREGGRCTLCAVPGRPEAIGADELARAWAERYSVRAPHAAERG
jgi:hypothetical protein